MHHHHWQAAVLRTELSRVFLILVRKHNTLRIENATEWSIKATWHPTTVSSRLLTPRNGEPHAASWRHPATLKRNKYALNWDIGSHREQYLVWNDTHTHTLGLSRVTAADFINSWLNVIIGFFVRSHPFTENLRKNWLPTKVTGHHPHLRARISGCQPAVARIWCRLSMCEMMCLILTLKPSIHPSSRPKSEINLSRRKTVKGIWGTKRARVAFHTERASKRICLINTRDFARTSRMRRGAHFYLIKRQ